MTPFKNRLKTPEEIELEHKYQQLAGVKAELQRRRDLKQPNMNFVIGRLSDFGKPGDAPWQTVRKVEIANGDPRAAWVDCDDLNNKEQNGVVNNDLHYTQPGYERLGRRYVRQAKAIIDGPSVSQR